MAKSKNRGLPHHVKERLRHRNLQNILENVASHVPKPMTTKRETKAKKLRRVVLYLKYLIHKKEELNKRNEKAVKIKTKCKDTAVKTDVIFPELSYSLKPKRKRAHIVFLTKSDVSANKLEGTETAVHKSSCNNRTNESEVQIEKNSINITDENDPKKALSSGDESELFIGKHNQAPSNMTDRYVPNVEMENLSDIDIDLSKKDYPVMFTPMSEIKEKTGYENIINHKFFDACKHRKEAINNELNDNVADLEKYIQEFSKNLQNFQKSYIFDNLERSSEDIYNNEQGANFVISPKILTSDKEYALDNDDKACSFSDSETLKSSQSSSNIQVDKHQFCKLPSFSQSSDDISLGGSSTFTVNNFEMPFSFDNSVQENSQQCCDNIEMDENRASKYKMYRDKSNNLSPGFFSSGESHTLTSLDSYEKPFPSSCPTRQKKDKPIQCDMNVAKHQFSKHPSFSQSSDNFSSDICSSGESSALMSSNEYILSENEHIGVTGVPHKICNTSSSTSFRPESIVDEDSYEYSFTSPQQNCDIISSPDIFCDIKQDVLSANSDFSADHILLKHRNKHPPLFFPNSERYLDYNIPVVYNAPYNNVMGDRFINYFGMNNYSQNLPLHALPGFAEIRNYPAHNIRNIARFSNTLPNNENYVMGTYSPERAHDFNRSLYPNEDIANYLDVPIKQEYIEPLLPPEELSYSLNNFTNSGHCYSQRDFNTH